MRIRLLVGTVFIIAVVIATVSSVFAQSITIQHQLGPLKPGNNADDPAYWVHPTVRNDSLMFLSDKDTGIFAYDWQGNQIQHVSFGSTLNNIDVRKGFNYNGQQIDILAGNLRAAGKLAVLKINPNWRSGGNPLSVLANETSSGNTISPDSYGFTLYRNPADGVMYVFDKSKNSDPIIQWRLDGSSGSITTTNVRQIGGMGVAEGMVADDALGYVYFVEETVGIHKYYADPARGNQKLLAFGGPQSVSDREGVGLYACNDGTGYIVLSSQGNHLFPVFKREGNNDHVLTFAAANSQTTDGLDVGSEAMPGFSNGFLIIHNDPAMDYHVFNWAQLGLTVCPDGGSGGTPTHTPVPTVSIQPSPTPGGGTCLNKYDLNCDGAANVLDVRVLVGIIFGGTGGGATPTPTTGGTTVTPTPTTGGGGGKYQVTAVTASADDGNVPANAIDGNLNTRWSASGDGQWIQFDVGTAKSISSIKIAWYLGDARVSRYDIQVSSDGSTWATVKSGGQSSSGTTTQLESTTITAVSARYVRIVGHMNSANAWNSITEVELW